MYNVVLFEPEIPPNTGNIIRLCASTGCSLHLIEPLGFNMTNKELRRAGLDYREFAKVQVYPNLDTYLVGRDANRVFAASTKGKSLYASCSFRTGDTFIFGPETRGLSENVRKSFKVIRIPMLKQTRSLNLSNAVAIVVYEALRQQGFSCID